MPDGKDGPARARAGPGRYRLNRVAQRLIRAMLLPARSTQRSSRRMSRLGTDRTFFVITVRLLREILVWLKALSRLCWMLWLTPVDTFSVVSSIGRITKYQTAARVATTTTTRTRPETIVPPITRETLSTTATEPVVR